MSYIFISYSKKNKDYAYQLADFFQENGFDIWLDNQKIESGVNWWNAIVKGLQGCSAFVVLMTPESLNSEWVQREVFLALEGKKPLFPLLLHGQNWPVFVLTQYADVSHKGMPDKDFLKRIAEYIPPKNNTGQDKTELPNQPAISEKVFDVHDAIAEFFQMYSLKKWSEAQEILGRIRASHEDSTPFDPDEFEYKVQQSVEEENRQRLAEEREHLAAKQYNTIRLMTQYADKTSICNALERFWRNFPNYDLDDFYMRYCTVTEPNLIFASVYTNDQKNYDESFSIEDINNNSEFLGECGLAISEENRVSNFEIWLFGRKEIVTKAIILMPEYYYNDPVIKEKISHIGTPVVGKSGYFYWLETEQIKMCARIIAIEYDKSSSPEKSAFKKVNITLRIWFK